MTRSTVSESEIEELKKLLSVLNDLPVREIHADWIPFLDKFIKQHDSSLLRFATVLEAVHWLILNNYDNFQKEKPGGWDYSCSFTNYHKPPLPGNPFTNKTVPEFSNPFVQESFVKYLKDEELLTEEGNINENYTRPNLQIG